jgi:hypothetical protein
MYQELGKKSEPYFSSRACAQIDFFFKEPGSNDVISQMAAKKMMSSADCNWMTYPFSKYVSDQLLKFAEKL